jgi:hypothetical protein
MLTMPCRKVFYGFTDILRRMATGRICADEYFQVARNYLRDERKSAHRTNPLMR